MRLLPCACPLYEREDTERGFSAYGSPSKEGLPPSRWDGAGGETRGRPTRAARAARATSQRPRPASSTSPFVCVSCIVFQTALLTAGPIWGQRGRAIHWRACEGGSVDGRLAQPANRRVSSPAVCVTAKDETKQTPRQRADGCDPLGRLLLVRANRVGRPPPRASSRVPRFHTEVQMYVLNIHIIDAHHC